MFLIVQFGGLLLTVATVNSLQTYQSYISAGPQVNSLEGAFIYLIEIVALAILLILIFKFLKSKYIFIIIEALVVVLATAFVLLLAFSDLLPNVSLTYLVVISAAISIILIIAKNLKQWLRNTLAVISSIGVGVLIGLNGFTFAFVLMLLISVYDYIAVFVTKHMLTIAQAASSRNLALLVGSSDVEAVPRKYVSSKDLKEFNKQVKASKIQDPTIKRLIDSGHVTVLSQVQLGTGDLAIPLMVSVSAYVTFLNYFAPVMVIAGAMCGMIFTMYLLKKYMVALPAIPPISAFVCLFLGIMFAIWNFGDFPVWGGFIALSVVTILLLLSKLNSIRRAAAK